MLPQPPGHYTPTRCPPFPHQKALGIASGTAKQEVLSLGSKEKEKHVQEERASSQLYQVVVALLKMVVIEAVLCGTVPFSLHTQRLQELAFLVGGFGAHQSCAQDLHGLRGTLLLALPDQSQFKT